MRVSQPAAIVEAAREPRRDLELFVLDAITIQAWDRLLFVGCGDGWIVEEAWRRAVRAYACGVDVSPELVTRAAALRGMELHRVLEPRGHLYLLDIDRRDVMLDGGDPAAGVIVHARKR